MNYSEALQFLFKPNAETDHQLQFMQQVHASVIAGTCTLDEHIRFVSIWCVLCDALYLKHKEIVGLRHPLVLPFSPRGSTNSYSHFVVYETLKLCKCLRAEIGVVLEFEKKIQKGELSTTSMGMSRANTFVNYCYAMIGLVNYCLKKVKERHVFCSRQMGTELEEMESEAQALRMMALWLRAGVLIQTYRIKKEDKTMSSVRMLPSRDDFDEIRMIVKLLHTTRCIIDEMKSEATPVRELIQEDCELKVLMYRGEYNMLSGRKLLAISFFRAAEDMNGEEMEQTGEMKAAFQELEGQRLIDIEGLEKVEPTCEEVSLFKEGKDPLAKTGMEEIFIMNTTFPSFYTADAKTSQYNTCLVCRKCIHKEESVIRLREDGHTCLDNSWTVHTACFQGERRDCSCPKLDISTGLFGISHSVSEAPFTWFSE